VSGELEKEKEKERKGKEVRLTDNIKVDMVLEADFAYKHHEETGGLQQAESHNISGRLLRHNSRPKRDSCRAPAHGEKLCVLEEPAITGMVGVKVGVLVAVADKPGQFPLRLEGGLQCL